tara:strand:- start:11 stop:586 length:576 start_codon:yes stop_codon:yes gene_type:complete
MKQQIMELDKKYRQGYQEYKVLKKSKGESRLDFGSIYLTIPNKKGIRSFVVIYDVFENDDKFYGKYVNVLPITDDVGFATDNDLILPQFKEGGPMTFNSVIHAKIQTTILIKDLEEYYSHLSEKHEKMLKEFLSLVQGDYSIDISKFLIGSPIISHIDYRIRYIQKIVEEIEHLVMPSMFETYKDMEVNND